ncbi:ornithine decarboxylase [Azospirillaceae bacterium]
MNEKITRFLTDHRPATPCLVIDIDVVEQNYKTLTESLQAAWVYYAVKANPAPEILKRLVALGSCFDTASVPEIEMVLAAGARPNQISYGNTIKKQADIARAYDLGVRLFAFDSDAELDKIAAAAPGSRVFCRLLTSNEGAEWPLSRKFGCDSEMAFSLLRSAPDKGVVPYGLSFHVGSQQRYPNQWDTAIAAAASVFTALQEVGVNLRMINLGGGLPTRYRKDVPPVERYTQAIMASLSRHFGDLLPEILIEPGRALVGSAGVIESEVVLISKKSFHDSKRWVYLDIGKFGGLIETMDEAIHYEFTCDRIVGDQETNCELSIIAGPTCDSTDVLYERTEYKLPIALQIGDHVRIHAAGAYTTTYASIGFNGFAPLTEYYI